MTARRGNRRRGRRSLLRWAALLIGAIVLGTLGATFVLVSYRPPKPPPTTLSPQEAQQAMRRVATQVESIRRDKVAGVRARHTLRLRSDDMNTILAAHPGLSAGMPPGVESIHSVRVNFEGSRIIVTGYVKAWGRETYLTVGGHAVPDGTGNLVFHPDQMLVGKLPMPTTMRAHIASRVQHEFRRRIAETGLSVQSVEMADGVMILQGVTGG